MSSLHHTCLRSRVSLEEEIPTLIVPVPEDLSPDLSAGHPLGPLHLLISRAFLLAPKPQEQWEVLEMGGLVSRLCLLFSDEAGSEEVGGRMDRKS